MGTTAPDIEDLRRIVRRHLPSAAYRAFLFGSRARGTAAPTADWDIGIDGPDELPGHVIQRILADLEDLPTLHRFDVVDMQTVPDSFRHSAMQETVPL